MSTSTVETFGKIGTILLIMINTTTSSTTTAVVVAIFLTFLRTMRAGNMRLNLNVDVNSLDLSGQGRSIEDKRVGGTFFAICLELSLQWLCKMTNL